MIRQRFETNFTPDHPLVMLPQEFPTIVLSLARQTFESIQPAFLDDLKFYPPERPNQKYVRTYKLRRGWKVGYRQINQTTAEIEVSNDTDYTSFVVGSLALNVSEAAQFQAEIHRNRWDLATVTVSTRFQEFINKLNKALANEFADVGKVVVRETPRIVR